MTAEPDSTVVDVDVRPQTSLASRTFLGLAVAALIAGALVISSTPVATPFASADAYVQDFYDRADGAGMFAALAPATYEGNAEQFQAGVSQVVQRPNAVATLVGEVTVNGVPLAIVDMDDTLRWCVGPDGELYVRCLVGTAEGTAAAEGTGLQTGFIGADLLGDTTQFVTVLGAEEAQTLAGTLQLVDEAGQPLADPVQAYYSVGGQSIPLESLDDVALEPGVALILIWEFDGAAGRETVLGRTLTVTWDGGSLPVSITAPTWFL